MLGLVGSASGSVLAGFAALDDKVPNEAARALSPNVGWWMLVCGIAVFALFLLQSDRWRRWWLTMEDPRSLGLMRILFGFFVICNVNDLWEYFTFLFTDEGIFTADIARQVHASAQFEGFGDGLGSPEDDPWGFFDIHAFLQFMQGPKFSLLYIWDSPTFFWIHLWVFEIVAAMFVVGLWTRTTAILTFFLMNSLFFRNHLFWEGTELVYRCFMAYFCVARAGHAYSVDNWLRCRKLRKQGLLSERGGPGNGAGVAPGEEHPKGLQAIYRLVPAWPRRVMMLQLATIYTTTGILKNGGVWGRGDALYYALNLDHFYRFYPQPMSYYFGTTVFRLMTWVTHWWEVLFPLVLVGLVTRWAIYEKVPPLSRGRLWGVRACWLMLAIASGMIVHVSYDVHMTPFPIEYWWPFWISITGFVGWLWWKLGNRPWRVSRIFKWKLPGTYVVDREWFSRWFLGRRLWLSLAVFFQMHVFILMNIGQFQTGMTAALVCYVTGWECAIILRSVGQVLGRWGVPWIPQDVKDGDPPIPSEDPTLPHHRRDAARLPDPVMAGLFVLVLAAIAVRIFLNPTWPWARLLYGVGLLAMALGIFYMRKNRGKTLPAVDPDTGRPRRPWAYGPMGRTFIGGLIIWHLAAVGIWLLPAKDSLHAWRGPARNIFTKYLTVTQTDQGWGMFAPNPPRSNVFMKVLVTDQDGEVWDMRTDVYAPERKPIPWIWNDRARKMNRRIIGGESGGGSWYRKWYARWQCRDWELSHEGVLPEKVELVKVWYQIPSPEQVRELGWYVPEQLLERSGKEQVVYTETCATGIMAQTPPWVRERHGLPAEGEHKFRPWLKHKKRKWDRKRQRAAEGGKPEKARLSPARRDQDRKAPAKADPKAN